MKADQPTRLPYKEVTLLKRGLIATFVLVLMLGLAASAFAFDGARNDYVNSATCASPGAGLTCHTTGGVAQAIYPIWQGSYHAQAGSFTDGTANALPVGEGPGCAGCHASNYDPTKAYGVTLPLASTATPTPTPTVTEYPPAVTNTNPSGDQAYSELGVGCSSCHHNGDTMHAPGFNFGSLANPDICGQCHARYSANKQTANGKSTSFVNGVSTASGVLQYPVNYNPFTTALTSVLNIPQANGASVSPAPSLTWWQDNGVNTVVANKSHGQGAIQYDEMVQGLFTGDPTAPGAQIEVTHFNSLASLKQAASAEGLSNATLQSCSHCMSADSRLLADKNGGALPAATQVSSLQYGDTCVACHDPHGKSSVPSVFNSARNPQLILPQAQLCDSCHNGHLATATFAPGAEVNHPQKEIMAGIGAIGVPKTPSVHKGDCVQCHMAPTTYGHDGAGTAANHSFKIITPEYASTHTTLVGGVATPMPNSACSQCHGTSTDPLARYLQTTLDARQSLFDERTTELEAAMNAAALKLGYANLAAFEAAWATRNTATATGGALNLLDAITNHNVTVADKSKGIHNWAYTSAAQLKGIDFADAVVATPYRVTAKASAATVKAGTFVKIKGAVAPGIDAIGRVTVQRKVRGVWKTITSALIAKGAYTASFKSVKGTYTLRVIFGAKTFTKSGVTYSRARGTSSTLTVIAK